MTKRNPHLSRDARETRDLIADELRAYGVKEFDVIRRSKHPAISFLVEGESVLIPFAGTASDHRTNMNTKHQVRRLLASKGLTKPIPAPRVKEREVPVVVPTPLPPPPTTSVVSTVQNFSEVKITDLSFDTNGQIVSFRLAEDFIVPKGELVTVNLAEQRVSHAPVEHEVEEEEVATPRTVMLTVRMQGDEEDDTPVQQRKRGPKRRDGSTVSPQFGRVLAALWRAQRASGRDMVESSTVRKYLPDEGDRNSVPVWFSRGQTAGLVMKVGPVPGNTRANYYRLSEEGRVVAQDICADQ